MRSRGTPRIEEKREAKRLSILESAVRSFGRHGFYGTSLEEIADRLKVTRASLYYYFRDKEEILAVCHLRALTAVNEVLDRVRSEGLPPEEAVCRLVTEHVRVMVDGFHGTALALDIEALSGARRSEVVAARDRFERGLREIVAQGVAQGAFRDVDPKLAAFAIFGAINWIARWYRAGGASSPEEIGRVFSRLFLEGLLRREERR